MPFSPAPDAASWSARFVAAAGLIVTLWLAGFSMRVTLLAIPPILPDLQQALSLSQADIGLLAGLPTLLFAFIAVPGAALVARVGIGRTILLGLIVIAVAGAARALSGGVGGLFAATLVMSAGIAVMQPAMPALARLWAPQHAGTATAVYSNGMLASEAVSAALTLPVVLPLVGGSWRGSLVFWSLPVVLAILLLAPRLRRKTPGTAAGVTPDAHWWPDWRDSRMWKLGLVTGGGSAIYYTVNGFLPGFLTHIGQPRLIAPALAAVNLGQIPPTLIILVGAKRVGLSRTAYVTIGLVAAVSGVGILTLHGAWLIAACAMIGFCGGFTITLGLALPALLAPANEVHRLAGAMLAVGYLFATVVPIVGGVAADITTTPATAFLPVVASGLLIAMVGAMLKTGRAERA